MTDYRRYWVGFNLVKGIGSVRLRALLDTFGDAKTAWEAPAADLMAAGLSSRITGTLLKIRSSVDLDQVMAKLQAQGITVLTWEDEGYPRRLSEIDQPPPVLYVSGDLLPEDEWAVGIVGTRRVTAYGRQVAEELARSLANCGVTVVSGLARGVDALAHQAAISAGGRTIAVLGSGVDRIYPPEHKRLAENIRAHGAVISDYPPGTAPDAANFPPRNRIISGLSTAIVVVEAGESSGALITAQFAAEQCRDIYAVPGSIYAPQSKGTNALLKQGAIPLLSPQDLLESMNVAMLGEQRTARTSLPSDPVEAKLFSLVGREPIHVDELRARAGLPIEQVSAALTMMELKGMVRQVGGMQYISVGELPADYQTDEIHEE